MNPRNRDEIKYQKTTLNNLKFRQGIQRISLILMMYLRNSIS